MNFPRHTRRRPHRWPAGVRVSSRETKAPRAFTLLELLLALGLIALLATVLIGGSTRVLSDRPLSTDDIFWKACAAARKAALQSGHDVRLAFADDRDHGRRFTVTDQGVPLDFPVAGPTDLAVNFLSAQDVPGSTVIIAGQAVNLQSLPFVTFYGDGTCTAFRVQIRTGVDAHVLSIDPWTCAPVLTPATDPL